MFDHIGLKTQDLAASVSFYAAALGPLGGELLAKDEGSAGFGHSDPVLWLYAAERVTGGAHLAFKAASRKAVGAFHARALETGGRDNGAPGLRTDYGAGYYAAFVTDPDGNNVEAVCLEVAG